MNIQKVLLKVLRAIRDFVASRIDSSVARESKKASCAALRSNASKNAFVKSSKNASRKACGSCTSRALLSLFVASATLLATFVIAPTSALSAGESAGANTVSTENTGDTKSDSAKTDGEKKQSKQSESNSAELNKKNTDTSSTLNKDNKELKPVEKQPNPASNNVVDKAKADETDVKKNVKGKDTSTKANGNGTYRSVKDAGLSKECGSKPFKRCYVVSYYNDKIVVDNNHPVLIQPGNTITIKPKFEIKLKGTKRKPAPMPSGVWFKLEQYLKYPVPSWANFEKDNGATKVKDTSKDKTGFDGSVTLRPNSKWDYGSYKFKVFAYYKKKSEKIYATISVKVDVPDISKNDLSLSLYDFENAQAGAAISDNKITIKPKTNSQGSSGGTTGSTDNKDTYDPIDNKLFIDSQSKYKPGFIYHRMICKTGTGDKASYTVDKVNGLSLNTQQFKHREGENRPDKNAENFALYESDPYTEESQSWISGTPTSAGTFECRVFAFKDAKLKRTLEGGKVTESSNLVKEFDARAETPEGKKSLFEGNIIEDKWKKDSPIQQGVECDYKSVTIEVKSNKSPEPKPSEIGDNDLTLKVYPFKNDDGSLPTALSSSNNKISAILGMSLKPFVDATSAADSKNKITLRVLCSNGANTGTGSQSGQPSVSSQPAEATLSSNPAGLGLSVPADDKQTRCNEAGDGKCTAKNVASQASMEVTLKPTEVGDYQCVVYALKPNAFNVQSGKQTPADIDAALAGDKSLTKNKDFAAFKLNIDSVSKFTLPHTGGQSWNLQLGILAALLVNLLAAGFVVSQSERGRKLILGRWRGLCNYV